MLYAEPWWCRGLEASLRDVGPLTPSSCGLLEPRLALVVGGTSAWLLKDAADEGE